MNSADLHGILLLLVPNKFLQFVSMTIAAKLQRDNFFQNVLSFPDKSDCSKQFFVVEFLPVIVSFYKTVSTCIIF